MDFGVARLESSVATASGHFFGSPSYMAPEQVARRRGDPPRRPLLLRGARLRGPHRPAAVRGGQHHRRHVQGRQRGRRPRRGSGTSTCPHELRRDLPQAPSPRRPTTASRTPRRWWRRWPRRTSTTSWPRSPRSRPPRRRPRAPETGRLRPPRPPTSAWTPSAGRAARRRARPWLALAALLALGGAAAGLREWARIGRDAAPATAPATFRVETEPAGAPSGWTRRRSASLPSPSPSAAAVHKVRVAVEGYAPAELTLRSSPAPRPRRCGSCWSRSRRGSPSPPSPRAQRCAWTGSPSARRRSRAASLALGRHEIRIEKRGFLPYVHTRGRRRPGRRSRSPPSSPAVGAGRGGRAGRRPPERRRRTAGGGRRWCRSTPPSTRPARSPATRRSIRTRRGALNLLGTVKVEMIVDEKGAAHEPPRGRVRGRDPRPGRGGRRAHAGATSPRTRTASR